MEGSLDLYLSSQQNIPCLRQNDNLLYTVEDRFSLIPQSINIQQEPLFSSLKQSEFIEQNLMGKQDKAQKKGGCNCKRTFCAKFYCECFSKLKGCGNKCSCISCKNIYNGERGQRILLKKKNLQKQRQEQKGCNCKKSHCMKNYCECYNSKNGCSSICKCLGCSNKYNSGLGKQIGENSATQKNLSKIILDNIDGFIDFN